MKFRKRFSSAIKVIVRGAVAILLLAFFYIILINFPTLLEKPDHVRAENTAYNLINSISAYFTEYRVHPIIDTKNDVEIESGSELMGILLGSGKQILPNGPNPRGIIFWSGSVARPMGNGRFRDGIQFDEGGSGVLVDPWGNPYQVHLDTNFDSQLENPKKPGTFLSKSILVWSAGPDGDFETWEDNVKTW